MRATLRFELPAMRTQVSAYMTPAGIRISGSAVHVYRFRESVLASAVRTARGNHDAQRVKGIRIHAIKAERPLLSLTRSRHHQVFGVVLPLLHAELNQSSEN